jgi:hypothetical protein
MPGVSSSFRFSPYALMAWEARSSQKMKRMFGVPFGAADASEVSNIRRVSSRAIMVGGW